MASIKFGYSVHKALRREKNKTTLCNIPPHILWVWYKYDGKMAYIFQAKIASRG